MSSNYGYKPSNASTFNQLIQQGVTVEEASTQSGVNTNASQYGFGTNSNAGAVIPGAGGIIDPVTGLAIVPYSQSGTGEPAQQPPQTNVPAAASLSGYGFGTGVVPSVPITQPVPTTNPITETQPDDRIISRTPDASSGFGYGTGINNPSVAPVAAADAADSPYAFRGAGPEFQPRATPVVPNAIVDPQQALQQRLNNQPAEQTVPNAIVDPQQALQQRLNNQPSDINANTSGLPIQNEQGDVVAGIRQNPETGETYYTDPPVTDPNPTDAPADVEQNDAETARLARLNLDATPNESAAETNRLLDKEVQAAVGTQLAQRQAVLEAQRKLVNNGDWRVRLSLAEGADYLYKASNPGILGPLNKTGGVIFPYMPKIDTSYTATYDPYSLTHSNHKGYFYKGSSVGAVGITGTFTAQDSVEAEYLLAVIHFFRSVTKMFYGQDAQRGAPPPLVFLTGIGLYQFSAHPCVVTSFNYTLPNDVDYIRALSPNINGTNLLTRRIRQDLPTDPVSGAVKRLSNLFTSQGINKGAQQDPPAPPTLGKNSPTYVPTKMDITISLLPMQTRAQVSQVFSLKSFANGDLIKGGFW